MRKPQLFRAAIDIPISDFGRIVTDRLTCRRDTHIMEKRLEEAHGFSKKQQYRLELLDLLSSAFSEKDATSTLCGPTPVELVTKFAALAETLATSKAIALPLNTWRDFGKAGAKMPRFDSPACLDEVSLEEVTVTDSLPTPETLQDHLVHPLSVALIAYHLGGPVNAAFGASTHEWKLPEGPANETHEFHVEGDTEDIFDELRLTIAWAEKDGQSVCFSGQHSIFFTGDCTPQPLLSSGSVDHTDSVSPVSILYQARHTALYYDSRDRDETRKSISLDFHLNTITDVDIQLLSINPEVADRNCRTVMELLKKFPVMSYATHFHHLLFATESMDAIYTKLRSLDVPAAQPRPDHSARLRQERLEVYTMDNWAQVPSAIKSVEVDIPLAGAYDSYASFLDIIFAKARRDMHLPIGLNLVPQTSLEQTMESARKFFRGLPVNFVTNRLGHYAQVLIQPAYTALDLLAANELNSLALRIQRLCLELVGIGFVNDTVSISSIAALASACGTAINGPKEGEVTAEPWVCEKDLQVFRTRCLYLFWCADWMACYLIRPTEGPLMMLAAQRSIGVLEKLKVEMNQNAGSLLRHWVAWGLFMEKLPQGGFYVRCGDRSARHILNGHSE